MATQTLVNSIRQALYTSNHLPSASLKVGRPKITGLNLGALCLERKEERSQPCRGKLQTSYGGSCCCRCCQHQKPFGMLACLPRPHVASVRPYPQDTQPGEVKWVAGERTSMRKGWVWVQHMTPPSQLALQLQVESRHRNRLIKPMCVFCLASTGCYCGGGI